MLTRVRTRLADAGVREAGFTLIEVLIALSLTAVIVGALAEALIVGVRTSDGTSQRLALSHDAEISARWFASDASSSDTVTTAASSCSDGVSSTPVVQFQWTEHTPNGGSPPGTVSH